jgi:hypothetical protein
MKTQPTQPNHVQTMKQLICAMAMCLCLLTVHTVKAQAQDINIQDYIDAYAGENAVPYLQPLSDMFSSNLHTGIWDWPTMPDRFYVRLKLQGIASWPEEDMRTFTARTTGNFEPEQTRVVPTIIGDRESILIQGDSGTFYVFPGGYDLNRVILGTPQLTVGGFLNTELSTRFLTTDLGDDVGRVNLFGIGARHMLTGWMDDPSLDVSVGYFYHHVEAGDYLNSDQHHISAQVGKSGRVLSGFVGAGYQFSYTDIDYVYDDPNSEESYNVSVDLENKNPWMVEAGLGVKLGPVFATSVLSYSGFPTLAVGAGLFF